MAILAGLALLQAGLTGMGVALGVCILKLLRRRERPGNVDTSGPETPAEGRREDRIQEGIANLLSYQAGGGREEER